MNYKFYGIFLIFIGLFSHTHAQTNNVRRDTVVTIKKDKYKVVTNKFFDNWFMGVSGGAQILLGDHDKQMQLKDRFTPAVNIFLGKAFTPGLAVRGGYTGYQVKGLTHNDWVSDKTHSTGEVYQEVKHPEDLGFLEIQKFNYNHLHADVLVNLSHVINGYNEKRIYSFSPYIGFGWAWVTSGEPKTSEPSINLGFYNTFKLSDAFNLSLDFRGAMMKDNFDGEVGNRKEEGVLSGTVGLVYNFKKRNWEREKIVEIIAYDETELNILREKANKIANDNQALKKQLEDAPDSTITELQIQNNVLVAPILITFPINKSTVSNEARANLGFFAKAIKEGKSNVVYNISGYADKGTGSSRTNERLSRERAEAIYNVLVREFGVPASQLTISHHGGVDNMYYDDPRLSRAVIVLGN